MESSGAKIIKLALAEPSMLIVEELQKVVQAGKRLEFYMARHMAIGDCILRIADQLPTLWRHSGGCPQRGIRGALLKRVACGESRLFCGTGQPGMLFALFLTWNSSIIRPCQPGAFPGPTA